MAATAGLSFGDDRFGSNFARWKIDQLTMSKSQVRNKNEFEIPANCIQRAVPSLPNLAKGQAKWFAGNPLLATQSRKYPSSLPWRGNILLWLAKVQLYRNMKWNGILCLCLTMPGDWRVKQSKVASRREALLEHNKRFLNVSSRWIYSARGTYCG